LERHVVIPEWKGSVFEKWSYNYCVKNGWRIAYVVGDMDDCMSECMLCYLECRRRYGETVKTEQQFMFLFMRMTAHWFDTLSKRDSKLREGKALITQALPKVVYAEADIHMSDTLIDASKELRSILEILINTPTEIIDTIKADLPNASGKNLFKGILKVCGIKEDKHEALTKELYGLLQ